MAESSEASQPEFQDSNGAQKTEPKWKRFEKLAYEIQKGLAGTAKVTLNDSIMGVDSKTPRQIDISIREQIGQYSILVVIDCKDYKEPVDVKAVEEFAGLVHDVRANKSAVISSNGFTGAALNVARNHGLDTFRLVDTEGVDWKSYVAIPVLLQRTFLDKYNLIFKGTAPILLPSSMDELFALELCSSDGTRLGTGKQILHSKWDKQEIPQQPGTQVVTLGTGVTVEFRGIRSKLDVESMVTVGRKYYLGPLPVHLKGFLDEKTGRIITTKILTDFIDPSRIERGEVSGWTEVANAVELSVKVTLRLGYSTAIRMAAEHRRRE